MRYEYCDSVRTQQGRYIVSLESELRKRFEIEENQNALLTNRADQIASMSRLMKLDTRQMELLIRDNRRLRRGVFWLKVGIGAAAAYGIYQSLH